VANIHTLYQTTKFILFLFKYFNKKLNKNKITLRLSTFFVNKDFQTKSRTPVRVKLKVGK